MQVLLLQSTSNVSCWLKTWMHVISLMSAKNMKYAHKAVQTIEHTLENLIQVSGSSELIYWLNRHLLRCYSCEDLPIIPVICTVLNKASPSLNDRSQIIHLITKFLTSTEDPYLVLENISKMGLEDMTVVSEGCWTF